MTADISFLVFKDAQGYYRLENNAAGEQERVNMSEAEATTRLSQEYMVYTFNRDNQPIAGKGPFSKAEAERVKLLCEETDWDDEGESWHIIPVTEDEPAIPDLFSDKERAEWSSAEADEMLQRNEAILFAMHLNNFFCYLAMWASRHVLPFEIATLEERVNYLLADSAWKDWLAGNQEFAALWEREGRDNVQV